VPISSKTPYTTPNCAMATKRGWLTPSVNLRNRSRSERVQGFAQWAAEHADSLDDLTAEQRREILQHVHPTVFVARKGSERPRLSLIFSVTEQAAARLDPQTLYTSVQWQDASGDFYMVYVDEYTGGNSDALHGPTLDLTRVDAAPMRDEDDDTASRDNPIRMSAHYAAGEPR
jgi:hypothetical protein